MGRATFNILRGKEISYGQCIHFNNKFFKILVFCKHEAIAEAPQFCCHGVRKANLSQAATNPGAHGVLNDASCNSATRVSSI